MASSDAISGGGIVGRFTLAIVVVFATYNPWGKSFFHWTVAPVFAAGGGTGTLGPLKRLIIGGILGIGMSWSHLSRKLTGQVDTDQVA